MSLKPRNKDFLTRSSDFTKFYFNKKNYLSKPTKKSLCKVSALCLFNAKAKHKRLSEYGCFCCPCEALIKMYTVTKQMPDRQCAYAEAEETIWSVDHMPVY